MYNLINIVSIGYVQGIDSEVRSLLTSTIIHEWNVISLEDRHVTSCAPPDIKLIVHIISETKTNITQMV